jgi:plastocyanin
MRKLLILFAAVLALTGATAATSGSTAVVNVAITSTGFAPREVVVRAGDSVVWRNADRATHQVASDTGLFKSPVLKTGESFTFRFSEPSSYSYHDGLRPARQGVVHVRGAEPTIGLTRLFVVYRNPVRIAGSIPNGRFGEQVTITMTRYGGVQESKTVTTDADGTFEFTDRPKIRTEYRATWSGTQSSESPHVNVRPLVVFNVLSARNNTYFVRVRAQRAYAGKIVRIQRRGSTGAWVTTKRVRLNLRSQARFRGSFPRGRTQARAWIGAAPGYIPGFSTTKTIRR